jgi:hypothetical protein
MKTTRILILLILVFIPLPANASWLQDIFNAAMKIYGINVDIRGLNQSQLKEMQGLSGISQSQLNEMNKISGGLMGTHQYGQKNYDANQFSWGEGSSDWQSILALAQTGGGEGALGSAMRQLANQFPMNKTLGSSNEVENEYYRMQAQTTLASRASAQTAFAQLNHEEAAMQQLHTMIDTTPDNKSAVDLNNRLLAENTLVNIQQAKLLAVLVQQTAMDSQEKANRAKENAAFFNIK